MLRHAMKVVHFSTIMKRQFDYWCSIIELIYLIRTTIPQVISLITKTNTTAYGVRSPGPVFG
jgi:hypothetical protein